MKTLLVSAAIIFAAATTDIRLTNAADRAPANATGIMVASLSPESLFRSPVINPTRIIPKTEHVVTEKSLSTNLFVIPDTWQIVMPEQPDFWSHVDDFESGPYISIYIGQDEWYYPWLKFSLNTVWTKEGSFGPGLQSIYPTSLVGPYRDNLSLVWVLSISLH